MRRRRWGAVFGLAALALAAAACDAPSAVRAREDRTAGTGRYGPPTTGGAGSFETSATAAPVAAPGGSAPPTASSREPSDEAGVDLTVVDPNGTPRLGVHVLLEGPAQPIRATSGAGGKVQRALPPGTYRVTAPEGCSGQLRTLRASTADLGVAAGAITTGRLVVEVTPRYEVTGPVDYDGDAGWRVGEVHRVRFRLTDPCGGEVPPVADYDAVRFVPSPGVELVGRPASSARASGQVEIDLRCVEPDVEVALAMVDALDGRRRAEVLDGALMDEQRPPFCIQPR